MNRPALAVALVLSCLIAPGCSRKRAAALDKGAPARRSPVRSALAGKDGSPSGFMVKGPESGPVDATWHDPATGLTWQRHATHLGVDWKGAGKHCASLDLGGKVDWRLPTFPELRTLVRGCPRVATGGACKIGAGSLSNAVWNGQCKGCAYRKGPTKGCYWPAGLTGECNWHFSASVDTRTNDGYWYLDFSNGYTYYDDFQFTNAITRCVRGPGK